MSTEKTDHRQWFLRITGGTVFGPVPTRGLILWAEQGRVVPGNEVSTDRENWISAADVPELEMRWFVEDADGKRIGPFNRAAADSFLKSGKAPEGARLVEGGEAAPAPDAGQPAAVERAPASTVPEKPPAEKPAAPRAARRSPEAALPLDEPPPAEADGRLRELETLLASVRANAEKDARQRERKLDALKHEVARLQEEIETLRAQPPAPADDATAARRIEELQRAAADERAALEREAGDLRARLAAVEPRLAEIAVQLGQRETECRKLAAERETLQRQLGAAMSAAADATNDSETLAADLRRQLEAAAAAAGELRGRLAQNETALAAERAAYADLLAESNSRDVASAGRAADLERRLRETEDRLAALEQAPPSGDAWVRQFAAEEVAALDKALQDERASLQTFRRLNAARQETLQTRIQALERVLANDAVESRRPAGRDRMTGRDQARLQTEVEDLRLSRQKETRQFEEREAELLRRVRILESEEARLRSQLEAPEAHAGRVQELQEALGCREQELAQERRGREQDRTQSQTTQQALLTRIEQLERAAADAGAGDAAAPAPSAAAEQKPAGLRSWFHREK
jgi:chromosome segregation ATPase